MGLFTLLFLLWLGSFILGNAFLWFTRNSQRIFGVSLVAPTIAVIRMSGIISDSGPGNFGNQFTINWRNFKSLFQRAVELPNLKAICLEINSPGGSPVQCSLMVKRITQLKQKYNVPVYAFLEDIAASGGYFIACSADAIIADESSIVGSIGVINSGFGFDEAIQTLKVKRRVHTAGKLKALFDPFLPEREEQLAVMENLLTHMHENFKNVVRNNRGDKIAKNTEDEVFSGAVFDGGAAFELGLVDEINERTSFCQAKFGDSLNFIELKKRPNFLEALAELRISGFNPSTFFWGDLSFFGLFGDFGMRNLFSNGNSTKIDLESLGDFVKMNPVLAFCNLGLTKFE